MSNQQTYTYPVENFIQYMDSNGINYVAIAPRDMNTEPWFNEMLEKYDLEYLTKQFPYIPLLLNQQTGLLYPADENCTYPPKVTNNFHILLAKKRDSQINNPDSLVEDKNTKTYKLDLEKAYPKETKQEPRNIQLKTEDCISKPEDGIALDNNKIPEKIEIPKINNWHPNRDSNGNYQSPAQFRLNNTYSYPYYNYIQNGSYKSYLPKYANYNDQYPF